MRFMDPIFNRIKLQDLRIFLAVVEAGSMGKAAKQLSVAQPNISSTIGNLEKSLGVKLLERRAQGVEVTAHGHALVECSVDIFDNLRQGLNTIKFISDSTTGELRVGTSPFLAATLVADAIDAMLRRYPNVTIHIVASPQTLRRELLERRVDFLVMRRFGYIADPPMEFEHLFDDDFVVVAGSGHKLAKRRKVIFADLLHEQWVLPPTGSGIASVAEDAFRRSGQEFRGPKVVASLSETRLRLIATGRFVSIFPTSVFKYFRKGADVKSLPVHLPAAPVPIGLITLKNRPRNPVAGLLIEQLRRRAATMV